MRRIPHFALFISLAFVLVACAERSMTREGMVYYPALHVYVLEDHPGIYYHEGYRGTYYRAAGDGWEQSSRAIGPWRPVNAYRLPPGLRKKVDRVR